MIGQAISDPAPGSPWRRTRMFSCVRRQGGTPAGTPPQLPDHWGGDLSARSTARSRAWGSIDLVRRSSGRGTHSHGPRCSGDLRPEGGQERALRAGFAPILIWTNDIIKGRGLSTLSPLILPRHRLLVFFPSRRACLRPMRPGTPHRMGDLRGTESNLWHVVCFRFVPKPQF